MNYLHHLATDAPKCKMIVSSIMRGYLGDQLGQYITMMFHLKKCFITVHVNKNCHKLPYCINVAALICSWTCTFGRKDHIQLKRTPKCNFPEDFHVKPYLNLISILNFWSAPIYQYLIRTGTYDLPSIFTTYLVVHKKFNQSGVCNGSNVC